ncbi:hypothetical protein BO221_28835 [Archangium sp. Cb G35]|uniref:hypothetical protein n=1 Tax=Archangium sp. Cb G35 TaxID=1920190 RepID=UPI0009380056|nr:hypothetical protein [Archangium sp. Cb G35]OJT20905.1 hypothetical protein BO221_28835 [Archangium sp. Cb G35]
MKLPLLLPVLLCVGCSAVSHGTKLSDRPPDGGRGLYLSTGGSPRPYRTLGFAQVLGYGVTMAGYADMGEAAIDGVIKKSLVDTAFRMGGDGVINIEFEDQNPPTDVERAAEFTESITNVASRSGEGVKVRERNVVVTGEVIQFISSQP